MFYSLAIILRQNLNNSNNFHMGREKEMVIEVLREIKDKEDDCIKQVRDAEEEAKKRISDAEKDADLFYDKIVSDAEKEADAEIEKARSSAEKDAEKIISQSKRDIARLKEISRPKIDDAVDYAIDFLFR